MWSKYLPAWKKEWRGNNHKSYDSANAARWGVWGGDSEDDENSVNSDTESEAGSVEEDFSIELGCFSI